MWRLSSTKILASQYGTSEDRCARTETGADFLLLRVFKIIGLVIINKPFDILPCRIKSDLYGDITTRTHKDLFSLWIPMTEIVSMQVCPVPIS